MGVRRVSGGIVILRMLEEAWWEGEAEGERYIGVVLGIHGCVVVSCCFSPLGIFIHFLQSYVVVLASRQSGRSVT